MTQQAPLTQFVEVVALDGLFRLRAEGPRERRHTSHARDDGRATGSSQQHVTKGSAMSFSAMRRRPEEERP